MGVNLALASQLIREAAGRGARFVTTPEMTNILEPDRGRLKALAKPETEDPAVRVFADLASELRIWLNVGSLALRGRDDRLVNRSLLFAADGSLACRYDKLHLFDVDLPTGERLRESEAYAPGERLAAADLPWCRLGLTICYDVRFPALYRALAQTGAAVVTVPSAFTVPTGEAHWHVLLRARAIENGCYVLAAAQGGRHDSGRETYGHSLAVSPWGEIIGEAGVEPGITLVEVDSEQASIARRRIPSLAHDRSIAIAGGELESTPPDC